MDEARFWDIVETVNWASDCDYERINKWMLNNMTKNEINDFRGILSDKVNALDKMIGDRNPAGCGDDSHSDLMYHVVGLGKEQYEAHLADYTLLAKRGKAKYGTPEGYRESFAYAVPWIK
jgi:aminoglycoside phosphotransferase family enzyme